MNNLALGVISERIGKNGKMKLIPAGRLPLKLTAPDRRDLEEFALTSDSIVAVGESIRDTEPNQPNRGIMFFGVSPLNPQEVRPANFDPRTIGRTHNEQLQFFLRMDSEVKWCDGSKITIEPTLVLEAHFRGGDREIGFYPWKIALSGPPQGEFEVSFEQFPDCLRSEHSSVLWGRADAEMSLKDGQARIHYKMETRGKELHLYRHDLRVPRDLVTKFEQASGFNRIGFKAKVERAWRKNFDWAD